MSFQKIRMTGAGTPVFLPHKSNGVPNDLYCAYSRIELSDERIACIMQDIKSHSSPLRVVMIHAGRILMVKQGSLPSEESVYLDPANQEIYLYDWYGYLEDCANSYRNTIEENYDKYKSYIEAGVGLDGCESAESGIARGELYSFTDIMDNLVAESEKQSLGKLFGGSYKKELKGKTAGTCTTEDSDPESDTAMYDFYNRTKRSIDRVRSNGQADQLGISIFNISVLLQNPYANETFLDYMFGNEAESRGLIETIEKCFYKWQEMLRKDEKQWRLKMWDDNKIFIDTGKIDNLTVFLNSGNITATAQNVYGIIKNASVFIYIAAGVGTKENAPPSEELWGILGTWLSGGLSNKKRFSLHLLMTAGILKGRPEIEKKGAMVTDEEGRKVPLIDVLENTAEWINIADGFYELHIPKIVKTVSGVAEPVFEFHNLLVEMELTNRMMRERRGGLAIPHFLSAAQSAVLLAIIKGGFEKGIAVGSFFSGIIAWANARNAVEAGNIEVTLVYVGSGVAFFVSALAAMNAAAAVSNASARAAPNAATATRGIGSLRGGKSGWFAVAATIAGIVQGAIADNNFKDRFRLFIRHSIWGNKDGDKPDRNEGALASWWPSFDIDKKLEELEPLEILISDKRMEDINWYRDLMLLNVNGNDLNHDNKAAETFKRNRYLLDIVTQLPLVEIDAHARDTSMTGFLALVPAQAISVSGIRNFLLIESVNIKLTDASGGEKPYEEMYTYKTGWDLPPSLPLHPLLLKGRDKELAGADEAVFAEKLMIVFLEAENREKTDSIRRLLPSPNRYVILAKDDMPEKGINRIWVKRKIEIKVKYNSDVLLPLRIEKEFLWNPTVTLGV